MFTALCYRRTVPRIQAFVQLLLSILPGAGPEPAGLRGCRTTSRRYNGEVCFEASGFPSHEKPEERCSCMQRKVLRALQPLPVPKRAYVCSHDDFLFEPLGFFGHCSVARFLQTTARHGGGWVASGMLLLF